MTPSRKEPRRVLLGLGAGEPVDRTIEAAARLASAMKSELLCLLVAQQDLINFAGLPFARAFGPGGYSSPITPEGIATHFNRLARAAERALEESCARTHVAWRMLRHQGETFRELSVALVEGDVVVVTLHDLRRSQQGLLGVARLFLDRAAAIVVASPVTSPRGPVLALVGSPGAAGAQALAGGIAGASDSQLITADLSDLRRFKGSASVIVAPVDVVASMGEAEFLRKAALLGATAVIVSE